MARISEYPVGAKLTGVELLDFSYPDAGEPSGFKTYQTTLQDVWDENPTLYTGNNQE